MELALDECGSPLGAYEIARRQHIPERFLEQIFGDLRRAGILESHRGAHGGFCFAVSPEEITVLDIVEILDGEIRPARCSAGGQCYTIAEIAAKERGTCANAPDDEADIDAETEPAATSILG
jgi:Rrf2 family transcriptional regulator, iron-sulfur cluster assembly transcription factor